MRLGLLALVALLALAPAASAHANLASAEPVPNSRAPVGLAEVSLRFTETIDPRASSVTVMESASGETYNDGPQRFTSEYDVRVEVRPLPDGVFSVSWIALSTADGHTTRGAFVFAVGNASLGVAPPPPVAYDESDYDATTIAREGFARAAFFGGLFLALGMPLFALYVLRGEAIPRRVLTVAGTFALVGAAGGLVTLLLLSRRLDFSLGDAAATVAGGSFARRAALLAASGAALFAAAAAPRLRRALTSFAVVLAVAAVVTTSFGSHAAGVRDQRALAIASDVLHLVMASVWIGGVVAFLHVLWGREAREVARLVARFSPLGIASVIAMIATGVFAISHHLSGPRELITEPYGQLVLGKILLMAPLIAIGAYNQRVLEPRLAAGTAPPTYFRRAVQAEAITMVLIIGLAGALASSAPPADDVATATGSGPTAPTFHLEQTAKRSHVVLDILPEKPTIGPSNVTITVHTADLPNGTQVYAKFEPPDADPEAELEAHVIPRVGPDAWSKEDTFFTAPGVWRLHVTIQRGSGFELERLTFEVPVSAGAGAINATNGGIG